MREICSYSGVEWRFASIWIIIFLTGSILASCTRVPEKSISDIDLLISLDAYPDEWEMYPKKDHLETDEGQESGAYVIFNNKDDLKMVRSGEDIYHYKSSKRAEFHYNRLRDTYFNDEGFYVTTPWEIPSDLSFISNIADDQKFACSGSNFSLGSQTGNSRTICSYLARYQEYIVSVNTTVEAEGKTYMTIEQLQSIIEKIDKKMEAIINSR
jgi:hypothetical protein